MFQRHIDFFAVSFIALILLAFSSLSTLRPPDFKDFIHIQSALTNLDRLDCR
jgi:hypothetical protein